MRLVYKQAENIAKYLIVFGVFLWILWYAIGIPIMLPLFINALQVYWFLDVKYFNIFC